MSIVAIEKLKGFVDPTQLMSSLGFNIFYDNNDEIRAPCIIHGGDNKTAFSFKKSSNRFYCYTHGCEQDAAGEVNNDVISLVMKVLGCGFSEAIEYLGALTGFDINSEDVDDNTVSEFEAKKDKDRFISGMQNRAALPEISSELISGYYEKGADYFLSLGFPQAIVDEFYLGTMVDMKGVVRGSIPIHDDNNRLVSVSCRRVDGKAEPRYLLLKNFKKRKVLYNLNRVIPLKAAYNNTVVVVEGFKAAWHVYLSGYRNVVAVMGRVIQPDQVNLLIKHGFDKCLLMLDGDEKGRLGMDKSLLLLEGKIDTMPIYLPQDISPDDVELGDLYSLISMFNF